METKNEIKIIYHINKEQEKQYLKVFFDVPDGVEAMSISYSYEGDEANSIPTFEKNVIDLAVLDYNGCDVGATGSSVRKITISESYSSPGYKKMAVKAGKWCIICGAYLIKKDGLDVNYKIDFKMKEYRYLKGDLHMHSVNSDGKYSVLELGNMAKDFGLDFIMTSDHNNFAHNNHLPEIPNLTIIPGVEFTHYNGHMNIWGVETPYKGCFAVNSLEEFKELNKEAHDNNAVISINHPLCAICPWLWGFEGFYYDAVEVWNGPMRQDNLKAVEWWHNELVKGRKLTAVGGSDYHHNHLKVINILSKPTTRIFAQSNSKDDILEAIKKGRCVVTAKANSSMIYLSSNGSVAGDTVTLKVDTTVKIKVDRLKRNHTLFVYDKNGVMHQHKAKVSSLYEIELPVKEKGFIRCEIKCKAKGFSKLLDKGITYLKHREDFFKKLPLFIYALTNPIYFE